MTLKKVLLYGALGVGGFVLFTKFLQPALTNATKTPAAK
jgi:hypothetical protein